MSYEYLLKHKTCFDIIITRFFFIIITAVLPEYHHPLRRKRIEIRWSKTVGHRKKSCICKTRPKTAGKGNYIHYKTAVFTVLRLSFLRSPNEWRSSSSIVVRHLGVTLQTLPSHIPLYYVRDWRSSEHI